MATSAWCCSRCGLKEPARRPPARCRSCGASRVHFLPASPSVERALRRPTRWSKLEVD